MDAPTTPKTENVELPSAETQSNKGRRKKSIVWDYFTVETVGDDCTRACCNQCKKSFAYISGSKLAGTSHLKRHIALGICPVSRQKNLPTSGLKTNPPKRRYRATPGLASTPFNQDHCTHEMTKMIIMHEYPLHIVEHPGFINFVRNLQPQYNMVSFISVQGNCVGMYLREKQSLLNFMSEIPGRVSLTLGMWTSSQTVGYVFLTGHFIDANWNLQRRILSVIMVPFPDSDDALHQAVVSCISDWSLEGKVFTLSLDQSFSNENVMGNLRGLLSVSNPFLLHGQLLIGFCYARVLSQLAQDAFGSMKEIISKIRESVKYVKISESHEEKFIELKHHLQVPSTKDLLIDDLNKWNTTYDMLVAACELKEVFACFDASDPDYKIALSMDDWKHVEILCIHLKLLFDAANIFTAPVYPTANIFFHEVWKLQIELTSSRMSDDPFISNLTKPLQEKFNTYWKNCCLVLAIPVVMDPRFKMKLVEFSFSKIYGEEAEMFIFAVENSVHQLFLEYVSQTLTIPATFMEEGNESICKTETVKETVMISSTDDGFPDFDVYISDMPSGQQMKSELDQYLEESLLPRAQEFDILNWWKLHRMKYPILSKMASDILSIPFSTIAPDSVFDTQSKKMDSYRSSLHPVTLEALICTKDWLQYGSSETYSPEFSNPNVKMEF